MSSEKKEYTLIDYIEVVVKNKKNIIITTSIFALIGIILFFFIIDPIYFSSGTIKSAGSDMSLSGLIGSSGLPDLGDLSEIAGSSSIAKELAYYESIILSRRCLEETIIKYNLMEENDYKFMQDAVKDFRENIIDLKKDKVAGLLEIGVYNKNPQTAKEITDFLIFQLNKINTELNIQNAKNNRKFIEERYDITKNELKNVEDSLESFQDRFGIAPDIQVQASIKAEVELEAEIKSEEIKLELLKKILSPDQPEVKTQQDKVEILKKQLNSIQTEPFEESNLNAQGSPKIVLEYLRYRRNVEIQNKILTTLIPLLEKAKIDENRETPTILILDNPVIPERKAKPKRITSVLIISFLAFTFSSLFFIFKIKWKEFSAILSKKISV